MNNQTFAGSELVGRNSELAVTLDLYKRAAAGHGSMLLIRGDGGIGKSRLAAETLSRARLMGAAVMSGHAAPSDRGLPYATFRELITNVPHGVPDDIVNQARALGDLLDLDSTPDDPIVWAGHPRNVLGAAIALIRRLSERAPLITLWEDLHVADSDSVSLFMRVARQLTGSPVLFVGTLRPQRTAETSDLERLVEQFELDGRGALVDLGALDRSDIHALVANLIGAIPDSATVDLVFESSRGNPFFATETTEALQAVLKVQPTLGLNELVNTGAVSIDIGQRRVFRDMFWKGSFAKDTLLGGEERLRVEQPERVNVREQLKAMDDSAVVTAFLGGPAARRAPRDRRSRGRGNRRLRERWRRWKVERILIRLAGVLPWDRF